MMINELLEKQSHFSSVEKIIAQYMQENVWKLETISARDIAKKLYISPSALTRFAQKLGFDGYPEFCKAYIQEYNYLQSHFQQINPNTPFERNDSDFIIASKIGNLYQEAIADTMSLITYDTLQACASLLTKAKTIYIVSAGTQNELAILFQEKMAKIGKVVIVPGYTDTSYFYATSANTEDCFILLSYSGETSSTLKVAHKLHDLHIPSIAITSLGNNSLATLCSYVINVSTREKLNRGIASYCTSISSMYVLDVLYSCVFKRNYAANLDHKYTIAKEFQTMRNSFNPILKDE